MAANGIYCVFLDKNAVALIITASIVVGVVFYRRDRRYPPLLITCPMIVYMLYLGYKHYNQAVIDDCQVSSGLPLNNMRKLFGVPVIGNNWKRYQRPVPNERYEHADWLSDSLGIGHYSKDIRVTAGCRITNENDVYGIRRQKAHLFIETKYNKAGLPDSLFYSYKIGDSTRIVDRRFADSLLSAEHIRKDF